MAFLAGHLGAPKQHRAGSGSQLSGDQLEESAFAGSIGPDQAPQLALVEAKINFVDCRYSAKVLGQASGFQDRRAIHAAAQRWPRASLRKVGMKPFGTTSTNRIRTIPSTRLGSILLNPNIAGSALV